MSITRSIATRLSLTPPVRVVGSLVRAALRRIARPDDYEKIAFSPLVGFFAVGERVAVAKLRNGLRIRVRTDDHVGRVLYAMGDFQPRVSWAVRQLLDRGDTVIDVGANIGWFVCTAAPIIGPEGRLEAFEPQAEIAQALRESVALNALSQVSIHEYALSDKNGIARFQVLAGNSGAGRIGNERGEGWREISVETRNALEVFQALDVGPIRMMKLDVEGHESTILQAAGPYFAANPPAIIVFESNSELGEFEGRPTVRWLRQFGYRIFQFRNSDNLAVEEITAATSKTFGSDFIAIHEGGRFAADVDRLR